MKPALLHPGMENTLPGIACRDSLEIERTGSSRSTQAQAVGAAQNPQHNLFHQDGRLPGQNAGYRLIPLTRGYVALVDSRDFKRLSKHKWSVMPASTQRYARTAIKGKTVLMHSLILPDRPGLYRDHINRNGLDNRRSNLRYATQSQNLANTAPRGRIGFKGVVLHPCGKYMARIMVGDKSHYLGLFTSPEVAARAFDKAAKKYQGEFAYLNFPEVIA